MLRKSASVAIATLAAAAIVTRNLAGWPGVP